MDSIAASVPPVVQFTASPPVIETKPPEVVAPAPSRQDSFESAAPKVNYAQVDAAQKTIASKGLFDLGKPVEPVVRDAGKELIAGKYSGPITDKEASVIRANLSGDQLKEFNKDYAAGKFSQPIESTKLGKLQEVLDNPKSNYNALRAEADTVKQLGYNMTAQRYKPTEVATALPPANGQRFNTKS